MIIDRPNGNKYSFDSDPVSDKNNGRVKKTLGERQEGCGTG
jgi:hypothetical protein